MCYAWLKQQRFDVAIVDPRLGRAPKTGRTLALLGGSQQALETAGLWKYAAAFGTKVTRVDVADLGSGGQVDYVAQEVASDALAFGFRQSELRNSLLVTLDRGTTFEAHLLSFVAAQDCATIELDNGVKIAAKLVVGADGRQSRARELARIEVDRTPYKQEALSFTIAHERSHRHTVVERMMPGGPLAILPVGERECGVTWVRSVGQEVDEVSDLLDAVDGMIDCRLGRLELTSKVDRFPLGALHAVKYVVPRLALIGDAAHGVHPIHAQGFNMGVADVASLVDVLIGARRRREDLGGACLRRYERSRRADNRSRLVMTDGLNRLFSNDIPPLMPIRRAVLGGLSAFAPLRQKAIRHGMRLEG